MLLTLLGIFSYVLLGSLSMGPRRCAALHLNLRLRDEQPPVGHLLRWRNCWICSSRAICCIIPDITEFFEQLVDVADRSHSGQRSPPPAMSRCRDFVAHRASSQLIIPSICLQVMPGSRSPPIMSATCPCRESSQID